MANKTEYEANDSYAFPVSERHEIVASSITLLETPVEGSVSIRGMEEVDSQPTETGKFKVDYENKTIAFNSAEEGTIEVIYDSLRQAYEAIITNKEAAIGEASCIWPVKNIRGFAA